MRVEDQYPSLADLKKLAKKRLPHMVWEYLDSATGNELNKRIDREAFDSYQMIPLILQGDLEIDLTVEFLGEKHSLPYGISPVGMSGYIYPNAELILQNTASKSGIPYTLSTLATLNPEALAKSNGSKWFQLYCPKDEAVMKDIIERVAASGFSSLVVTVDLPAASTRERQLRAGLTIPPKFGLKEIVDAVRKPKWCLGQLRNWPLRMATLDKYGSVASLSSTEHYGYSMRTNPTIEYLEKVRRLWDGNLIIKGVQNPDAINSLESLGVDALWISNHGGRQFQSGIPSIEVLKSLRPLTKMPLIFDSGIESGLDIIKGYDAGADFVMLGRAWHYALAGLGDAGGDYLVAILNRDLVSNLAQLGRRTIN